MLFYCLATLLSNNDIKDLEILLIFQSMLVVFNEFN